ncbi:MAG: pyridoxamine 5'-phosphate oxidase family protein [Actinomycetota bacterium]|nr:pyridoxamine 5'-phosphate oxidase family protein [Actinomycetota bacterium]
MAFNRPDPAESPLRTTRTELKRKRERGSHDRSVVEEILDEGLVAHVGVVADGGPIVTPMAYARIDGDLFLHGAAGNRTLRALAEDSALCLTVTLLDGLVLARSAIHHSMNYRCVVLYGRGHRVEDEAEKRRALAAVVDHVVPGRSAVARPPTSLELRATLVVRVPIVEASAKVRGGGPVDDDADLELPVWAGVIPVEVIADAPVGDSALKAETTAPVSRLRG